MAILGFALPTLIAVGAPVEGGLFTDKPPFGDGENASSPIGSQQPTEIAEIAIRSRSVGVDFAKLDGARTALLQKAPPPENESGSDESDRTVRLNLFGDATYIATIERTADTSGGYSLTGRIKGAHFGQVTLAIDEDIVFGSVSTPQKTFWIRSYPGREYWVIQVDHSKYRVLHESEIELEDQRQ